MVRFEKYMEEYKVLKDESLLLNVEFDRFKKEVDDCSDIDILKSALLLLTYKEKPIIGYWDHHNYISNKIKA